MTNSHPTDSGRAPRIERQHRRLRAMVANLCDTHDVSSALNQLTDLRIELQAHFREEERSDGLRAVVGESAPRLVRQLDHILDEHRELTRTIDALIERCTALRDGPCAALFRDIAAMGQALTEHEQRENMLLIDAVETDIGGAD